MSTALIAKSLLLFVAAGICEIGGGYLVWLWLREGRGVVLGALGGLVLFLYGVLPTFQPAHFGRVYASLRRCVRRALASMGLVDRWTPSGRRRLDRRGFLRRRSGSHHVLATLVNEGEPRRALGR